MDLGDKSISELARELAQIPFFDDLGPGALLKRVPFFKNVDEQLLEEIAPQCVLRVLQVGQAACRQGEYGDTFYLILKGKFEVSIRTRENPQIPLAVLSQGDFFGEYAPLAEMPRTATVTALDRSILIEVSKEAFLTLREKSESVKTRIDEVYLKRVLTNQLRQVSLFSDLPDDVLEALKANVELKEFDRGDVIIRQGEPGDSLYLIRAGFVKVRVGEGENERVFAYLKGGAYFGEMSLLRGEKRTADVVAVTRVELVKINAADFQGILEKFPEVKARLEQVVADREKGTKEITRDDELARKMKFAVDTGLVQAGHILVVDLDVCVQCNSCVEACAATHEGYPRIERRGQRLGHILLPTTCLHCSNPECMLCPYGGIYRDKNGEIHHTMQCIHCGGCAHRCPYGNILVIDIEEKKPLKLFGSLSKKVDREAAEEGASPGMPRRRVVKCDMCTERSFVACVYNCPVGACRLITPEEFLLLSTQ